MKLLIGRKVGMSQVFDDLGTVTPVTVLEVGPCPVVQVKSEERDGYRSVQIGFAPRLPSRVSRPLSGHFRKAGVEPLGVLRESPLDPDEEREAGEVVTVDHVFSAGQLVDVIGISKGRGYQGTVRRYGFGRGPMSHGSKNIREPGSTGMHTYPGRVFKGKRLPGQMGNARTTVKNLKVVAVDAGKNRLLIRGAVPGPAGGVVEVRIAKTPPRPKQPQPKKGKK